ncbi:hypothetical protein IF2G_11133 [Cordyceps javanica]|nr:hypothetical protein IF2G_11133 [Cordyceps javanica]
MPRMSEVEVLRLHFSLTAHLQHIVQLSRTLLAAFQVTGGVQDCARPCVYKSFLCLICPVGARAVADLAFHHAAVNTQLLHRWHGCCVVIDLPGTAALGLKDGGEWRCQGEWLVRSRQAIASKKHSIDMSLSSFIPISAIHLALPLIVWHRSSEQNASYCAHATVSCPTPKAFPGSQKPSQIRLRHRVDAVRDDS